MPDFKKAREKQQQQYKTQQVIETVDVFHQPDVQTLEGSDAQTLERADVQDVGRSDVLTSKRQNLQTSELLDVQEKSKPDRNRQTIYLELDLDDWIREHIIRERRRLGHRVEISDIVNEALRLYRDSKSSSS